MNLVDEEHVALFEVADDRGEVAGALDRRPRGRAHVDPELARDDMGERGLAQSRRPREQHVVEDLAALARRLDRHAEDFLSALLADELAERARAQREIEADPPRLWPAAASAASASATASPLLVEVLFLSFHRATPRAIRGLWLSRSLRAPRARRSNPRRVWLPTGL